jgi:class 3 adenylate cyclase/cbb3-type cytochrome oxidase subunit 3
MKDDAIAPDDQSSAVERRLATILMADVFGYSRMMGEDEERTVRTFRGHRAVFDELLKVHRGRVFNTAGDAILAEFPSAVEAVRCATEIQAALRTRNEHLPEEQRMWFRIGINLGDVIIQGGDLLGDGVNIAARIQTVAEPGGVCISGSVYDQIQNKLTLQIKQLGEKSFKNIALPVRTFSIIDNDGSQRATGVRWRGQRAGRLAAQAGVAALLIALIGAGYWLYRDLGQKAEEQARRAEASQRAAETQRKSEQDKAASATAEKEARLVAELQAARDALTEADANKRRAEQERMAAEAAQREAKLQGELKSAKDALQKADQSDKKADQDRKAASAAVKSAERAAQKTGEAPVPEPRVSAQKAPDAAPAEVKAPAASPATAASDAKSANRYDGIYAGRMCTVNSDGSPRCWNLGATVQHGALSATWITRFNSQRGHAKGAVSPDGAVSLTLDGYNPLGKALAGTASGKWANNKITVSGSWSNNVPIDASWTLAAEASTATGDNREPGRNDGQSNTDQVAPSGRGGRARR